MDSSREHQPAPERLSDIPEHVRKWLNSMDEEDIARFHKWNAFIVWAETTGRVGKFALGTALAIFGAVVAVVQGWDWLSKWVKG